MIDRKALLADLQDLLRQLEADLLERSESDEVPEVGEALRAEFARAQQAQRTAQNFEDWRADATTQAAAAWVLSCVFVRFLEDNRLVEPPRIAGLGDRLARARDEHELYFRKHPTETDRHYLLAAFDELARLPGAKDIFGEHNPFRELPNWLSGDAAGELLRFFQKIDANTGALVHDFTDPDWDTRFLGDLYQDLSETTRKKYALLQTPEFVEEFILDRTLDPAIEEFGLAGFRMIDPACGSGHFLLGSFRRILDRWQKKEPGTKVRDLVQKALDSIHGVDLNPYAVVIARFRLLLAAMRASNIRTLADAPAFQLNIVCGDSLLHGVGAQASLGWHEFDHVYQAEDHKELVQVLKPSHYHAVVANPPYITPKDKAMNDAYRERYSACHMKYSLSVPFMQRLFQLTVRGDGNGQGASGYVGQITANSFMKREFGKKLIEEFLPTVDLSHVIDTSGAYIPGHGTPTVILFGRNRRPISGTLRTVMGIRGEPSTPNDPAQGVVWTAITAQVDQPDSQGSFVSVCDSLRDNFHKHPWSIGGGGAAELKEELHAVATSTLAALVDSIGPPSFAGVDDMFFSTENALRRAGVEPNLIRQLISGDVVRDWVIARDIDCLVPYDNNHNLLAFDASAPWGRYVWLTKASSEGMVSFNKQTRRELREPWWSWYRWIPGRFKTPYAIVFAEVATHNHFALDRGGRVFKQTAPVIKLPADATEDDHLALLGLLNSSTACFWMKQVCFPKGTTTGDISTEKGRAEANRFAFNSTALENFPLPNWSEACRQEVIATARAITFRGEQINQLQSQQRIEELLSKVDRKLFLSLLEQDRNAIERLKREMVFLQEELDWSVYEAYGFVHGTIKTNVNDDVQQATKSERPFCADADIDASIAQSDVWKSRRQIIGAVDAIRLIETPVYKRLWAGRQGVYGLASRTVAEQQRDQLEQLLLSRLESYFDFDGRMNEPSGRTAKLGTELSSTAQIADIADGDSDFHNLGAALQGDFAFDLPRLVAELVESQSVPLLPILRYKASGLRKRAEWQQTWELQREEDQLRSHLADLEEEAHAKRAEHDGDLPRDIERILALIGKDIAAQKQKCHEFAAAIPVPPKYTSGDFLKSDYWRLRGKLDVPKERWVSFPHCEGPDGTLVVAWAGYDHLQLATAVGQYYQRVKDEFGGSDDPRLTPLLACLIELLPWLKQWHNEVSAEFGVPMGEYFEGFVQEEARQLGKTLPEIQSWQPPARTSGRRRRATT
ncbi:MAG: BREX-2 system adenine-specific DNA-methyltransferase PglX [Planctomycetes bacterium]|nr:BREX-2 system adenine-specific DNA-methyltransferase PglX [Planctomycetota bacterium]